MDQAEGASKLHAIFDRVFTLRLMPKPVTSAKAVPECNSLRQISLFESVKKAFQARIHVAGVQKTRKTGKGHSSSVFWI